MNSSAGKFHVTPTELPRTLLSILPCHPMASLLGASEPPHPGLVSPTNSQPAFRKNSIVSSSSVDNPILSCPQQTSASDRCNDLLKGSREHHALIFPRPPSQDLQEAAPSVAFPAVPPLRLNRFVKRLHDMLVLEKDSGIVEWRRGLLVIFSTDAFSKKILPKYFNTRNFKTFRRQLNYYGFVHVRSFSATGNSTTALWINQELARNEANDDVSAVLKLRRVEPNEAAKTVEGRRQRKELALHTVEEDIGLDAKRLQLDQIRSMAIRGEDAAAGGLHIKGLVLPPAFTSKTWVGVDIPRIVNVHSNSVDDSSDSQSEPDAHHENGKSSLACFNPLENNTAAANMLLMLAKSS